MRRDTETTTDSSDRGHARFNYDERSLALFWTDLRKAGKGPEAGHLGCSASNVCISFAMRDWVRRFDLFCAVPLLMNIAIAGARYLRSLQGQNGQIALPSAHWDPEAVARGRH